MMSVTRCTEDTISLMVCPALRTSTEPSATWLTEVSISPLISLAAPAERWARVRTSLATTAKPRPCSPARAASTAALSAKMLVWKAMPSMTEMMSAILFEDASMPLIVATTWPTTSPPCEATEAAPTASWLAWRACSAFCFTVEVNSSIEAAVSSRLAACCSVRRDRSSLPAAISLAAALMLIAALWMPPTMVDSCSAVALASSRIRANTPLNSPCMRSVRSPAAMACSIVDKDCRLPSAVAISWFRLSTMARKSYWKRCASPRTLKSPAAAAAVSRPISPLIAVRFCFTAFMALVMVAFSPGSCGISSEKSPIA